jgi:hypothetical protein
LDIGTAQHTVLHIHALPVLLQLPVTSAPHKMKSNTSLIPSIPFHIIVNFIQFWRVGPSPSKANHHLFSEVKSESDREITT